MDTLLRELSRDLPVKYFPRIGQVSLSTGFSYNHFSLIFKKYAFFSHKIAKFLVVNKILSCLVGLLPCNRVTRSEFPTVGDLRRA